eukprot:UN04485
MIGWPYIHLHTGNVIVQRGVCKLSDIEDPFVGHPVQSDIQEKVNALLFLNDELDPIAIMFGHVIYEMATGLETTEPSPMDSLRNINIKLSKEIVGILGYIFGTGGVHTAERHTYQDLLNLKFFNRYAQDWDASVSTDIRDENKEVRRILASVKT